MFVKPKFQQKQSAIFAKNLPKFNAAKTIRTVSSFCTPEQAVQLIQSGHRVFVHSVAATPHALVKAMIGRAPELKNVEICHIHTEGPAEYADPKYVDNFFVNNFFVGANVRKAVQEGRAGYVPVFLSEVPLLFERRILPLDVAMISISPPDKHGYCSLGPSVDVTLTAIKNARFVIGQINKHMPRTHGDGIIHISNLTAATEFHEPLHELPRKPLTDEEKRIGINVASLIEDGATLQMGIGSIPDAVLAALSRHKDLGIHSEMFSDGVLELVEKGVINNTKKKLFPGKIVGGFVNGSKKLFDFIDDNPYVSMLNISYVNNPINIMQNPKVTAINSGIEVDLTGQVCADSIGGTIFSGVGGQMDFMRGAALSEGGKPIMALPSVTRNGRSRIVPYLQPGAGVVTTRAHVHYVATEWGVAYLYGKNLHQRMEAMVKIAHPMHRDWLMANIQKQFWRSSTLPVPPPPIPASFAKGSSKDD